MKKEYKYIDLIPKPLLDDLLQRKVIPIVGAGFSKNADIPSALQMPDWPELGKAVAKEIRDYEYGNDPIDTLSYYEQLFSRQKLIELLMRELLIGKVRHGATFNAFCGVFKQGVVCTTNFDFLLEEAYRENHIPVSVIATEDRLSVTPKDETRLIKLHGDFNHPDRMVVTEGDYDVFAARNPVLATYLSSLFITNTMLLIGYSLDDYDFRNLWQIINYRLGNMSPLAYCIMVGAEPAKIAKYARRNINVINLPGEPQDYKTILYEFFTEIDEYITENQQITSPDNKILEQIRFPTGSNRLCFVSCARTRLNQQKEIVYPILREAGITPIRIDDFLSPGDNWMDVSKAVIRKSNMVIVDISDHSSNVMYELALAQSEKPAALILIAEKGTIIPSDLMGQRILYYAYDLDNDLKTLGCFQKELKERCHSILGADILLEKNFKETDRLFEKQEYSYCIISAFTELERLMQQRSKDEVRFSMIDVLKELVASGDCDPETYRKAQNYLQLRNRIVHDGYAATKEEAEQTMAFVKELDKAHYSYSLHNISEQYDFGSNEAIAERYARVLRGHTAAPEGNDPDQSIGKLHELHGKFPQNEVIAEEYAIGLFNRTVDLKEIGCRDCAARLEEIYRIFPNDGIILLSYAKGLVNLSFKQQLSGAEDSAAKLSALHEKYSANEGIAHAYAGGLANLTAKQQLSGAEDSAAKLSALHEKYLGNEGFAYAYAAGLVNLSFKQQLSGAEDSAEKLRTLHETYPGNEEIACVYASGLEILTAKQELSGAEDSAARLRALHETYSANEEIALEYANGLSNLTAKQQLSDAEDSVAKLRALHEAYPANEEIALAYTGGLVNLSAEQQLSGCEASISKLRELHETHSENESIAYYYAAGLVNLSNAQQLQECKDSVSKLRALHERYPGNEEIALAYASSFVTLSFKQTSEETVQQSVQEAKRLADRFESNKDIFQSYAMTKFNLTLQQGEEDLQRTVEELQRELQDHPEANKGFQKELDTYLEEHPDHSERYLPLRG